MNDKRETLVAVFPGPRELIEGIKATMRSGAEVVETLSPVPVAEVDELLPQRPSMVPWFTLLGCISGAVVGMGLQIGTVMQWPHLVGGKPAISLPAFVVVTFEMTILLGAVATFVGLLLNAKLPQITKEYYHSGCAKSDFALVLRHDPAERASVESMLFEAGAQEVRAVEAGMVLLGAD